MTDSRGFEDRLATHQRFIALLDPAAVYRGVEQYFFVGPLQPPTLPSIRPLTMEQICGAWRGLAEGIRSGKNPELLNLYIHIPFCMQRCTYCIFHSETTASERLAQYLVGLEAEMSHLAEVLDGMRFLTCYLGGGTPTVLSEKQIGGLLDQLDRCFGRRRGGQWAFECNPESVTEGKARLFADHGFNHVNIGVQTLDPDVLVHVNRAYQTESMVFDSLETLKKQRFYINVDLLHGLPGDSLDSELRTFERILARDPHRVTIYNLSPSTPLQDRGSIELAELAERILPLAEPAGYFATIDTTCIEVDRDDSTSLMNDEVELAGERVPYDDTTDRPFSLLGLGRSARSYIYGRMTYQRDKRDLGERLETRAPIARGRDLAESEEQRRFITKRLADQGLALHEYETRFREPFDARFRAERDALFSLGLLEERDGVLVHTEADPAARFAAELFFVEDDRLDAAREHLRQEHGPSAEESPSGGQHAITLAADRLELPLALTCYSPGDNCYHHHGSFAFLIPRPTDPKRSARSLGPFEETLLRAFARLFDRVVDDERPQRVQDLIEALLGRGQTLVLTVRTPAGPERHRVSIAPGRTEDSDD